MPLNRKILVRTILGALSLSLTYVAFRSDMNYMQSGLGKPAADSIFTTKTVYKTILCTDSADLLGFELHKRYISSGGSTRTEYNVVMRALDPRIDTYKAYCRDIFNDLIAQAAPGASIVVNVFDSSEAYASYAEQGAPGALLPEHLVATYERTPCDNGTYCKITYYPWSVTVLRETEGCI